jgi:ABC-type glutathione transport system ATPase component
VSVLRLEEVSVQLPRLGQMAPVLRDVSFTIAAGEMLALVGESGSGKTTTALAVPRLLPPGAAVSGGIFLNGVDLGALAPPLLRRARGTDIGMVFQDPLAALNPAQRVGTQIAEPIRVHTGADRATAWARAVALLDSVGIENAGARARDYPHQFSGGMRQRAVIAGALACGPKLLIADEPTSGLDPLLARQILDLLARLRRERGLAVLLVSHDLAVVGRYADRVIMLRQGAIAKGAPPASQIMRRAGTAPESGDVLRVEQLSVTYASGFGRRAKARPALSGAGFSLRRGECLGVVGASGSGKTTLGRAVLQMIPYQGRVVLDGQDLAALSGAALLRARRRIQAVFQDPSGSLNPLMTVADIVGEALMLGAPGGADSGKLARRARAAELLRKVGLPEAFLNRRPGSLSGGQAQRVAIARALAAEPDLIVLDEPTSSLDAAAQAGLLTLLADLARDRQLGYIVITHDLAVVRRLAHRIAILHQGAIVELEDAETLIRSPRHEVTAALLEAANVTA